MRINYQFPFFYERLSPRQKARMAAEAAQNCPSIQMEGRSLAVLRISRLSNSLSQDADDERIKGGLQSFD